jgi:1,3-beta-glucan synthase
MSGHPQPPSAQAGQAHYDEGYSQHQQGNTDSYYQDDHGQPYYDNNDGYADQQHPQGQHPPQGADGYYDESCVAFKLIYPRPQANHC